MAEANLTEGIRAAEGRLNAMPGGAASVLALGATTGQKRLEQLGDLEKRGREATATQQEQDFELAQIRARGTATAAGRAQDPEAERQRTITTIANRLMQGVSQLPPDEAFAQAKAQVEAGQQFFATDADTPANLAEEAAMGPPAALLAQPTQATQPSAPIPPGFEEMQAEIRELRAADNTPEQIQAIFAQRGIQIRIQ